MRVYAITLNIGNVLRTLDDLNNALNTCLAFCKKVFGTKEHPALTCECDAGHGS